MYNKGAKPHYAKETNKNHLIIYSSIVLVKIILKILGVQTVGKLIVHTCNKGYLFDSGHPVNIYKCTSGGRWTKNLDGDRCKRKLLCNHS